MRLIKLTSIVLLTLCLGTVSCSDGEDGAQGQQGLTGEKGDTGQQGEVGENGENGADGANGEGYDELTQYGYITMNVSGTRPDGVPFEDTATFKFSQTNPFEGFGFGEQDNVSFFSASRFLSTPDIQYQEARITMSIGISDLGGPMEQLEGISFYLISYPVVGDDNKYFKLNVATNDFIINPDIIIENLSFDPVDNHLTYSYSFILPADNNNEVPLNTSGHELQLSGEVDVYLLEEL